MDETRLGHDTLLTVPEAGRRLGVGRRQLRRALQAGELVVYDVGSWPRVRWGDVLAWLDRRRRPLPREVGARAMEQT